MAAIDLPDINVWVALTIKQHPHHARAQQYWQDESGFRIAFNSHTMLGFVRVISNLPQSIVHPVPVTVAWNLYLDWMRDPSVKFAEEPIQCHLILDRIVQAGAVRPKTWSDAYLASFAEASDLRLVSFDRDFKTYSGLNLLHLQA